MPAAVAVTQGFDSRGDAFGLDAFDVGWQAGLLNQQEKVLSVGDQPLEQTLVNRQVFRGRILEEHALVLAFAE